MQWVQPSNLPCRQSVTVCGYESGPQNNWVISQYISRRVNGILLPQVSVQVVFELQGCPTALNCRRTFLLYEYEASTENSADARNTSNYQLLLNGRVAPEDASGASQNQTRQINFDSDAEGFYVAIRDETTCIVVTRVIVFYNVCPGGPAELVMRPETLAPPVGLSSQLSVWTMPVQRVGTQSS